jgi:hypothetical protein
MFYYKELSKPVITISIFLSLLCTICGCNSSQDKHDNFYAIPKIITHDPNHYSVEDNLINPNTFRLDRNDSQSLYQVAYDTKLDPGTR